MLAELFRKNRSVKVQEQTPRFGVEELSRRLLLSGDIIVDPPPPPPPPPPGEYEPE